MIKYQNILLPIVIIIIGLSACQKEDSPLSPTQTENSIQGIWQESFNGDPNLERVIKNVSGQYIIYEPDSIFKTSQLIIDKDSFQVIVNQIYFLDGDILLENQEELKGIFEILSDTISFIDSRQKREKYYFELKEKYLQFIYAPVLQGGDSLIWISSEIGIPWGKSSFKYRGKFSRIE